MKHFFIIAGGKIEDAFAIEVLKGFAEKTVIAADSGMEFLRRNEIVPQVIIGDFDSVSKETLEWFQKKEGIVWHRLNPQKDDTDTEFALRLAISMGAECITVLGGTGSRLDHVLGNIELLGIGLELGVEIELLDANNRIRMTDHGMVLKKEEQFGKYVSLIPYFCKTVIVFGSQCGSQRRIGSSALQVYRAYRCSKGKTLTENGVPVAFLI